MYYREEIENMTGPELVAAYNTLTGENVKRFGDRKSGLRRTLAALDAKGQAKPAKAEPKAKPKPTDKPKAKAPRTPRHIDWPAKKEKKTHRPGTKRAVVVDLLSRKSGATRDDLMKATGWDEKTLYDGLRLVHVYLGHGIREDETGHLHLVR